MMAGSRLVLAFFLTVATTLGAAPAVRAGIPRTDGFSSLCGAMDGSHPARVKHVMFILFENRSYPAVVGSGAAPYLNNKLIPGCGLATNYHNIGHPSLPNYIAATSGLGLASSGENTPARCRILFDESGSSSRSRNSLR